MRIEILYRYYQILTHSEGGRGALSNLIFVIISCDIEVLYDVTAYFLLKGIDSFLLSDEVFCEKWINKKLLLNI